MIAPIYQILANDAGVQAVVGGTTGNYSIFPEGNIPQETTLFPVVAFQTVTGMSENVQSGSATADYERIQIDCWGVSLASADALFIAVRAALENIPALKALGCSCVLSTHNGNYFDNDTKRSKNSTDWDFWTLRLF